MDEPRFGEGDEEEDWVTIPERRGGAQKDGRDGKEEEGGEWAFRVQGSSLAA